MVPGLILAAPLLTLFYYIILYNTTTWRSPGKAWLEAADIIVV